MEWWQALILGIVEGLTEYLPVSSTGHLILAQRLIGIEEGEAANAYAICIQAGAIAAVLGLYRGRVRSVLAGFFGRDAQGLRLGLALVAAFAPAATLGLLFDERIEEHLFGLWPVVGAWLVGGLAILAAARIPRARAEIGGLALELLSWRGGLLIGLAQCLALWPGTSRSLVTILAGLLIGLRLAAAVEFSFLLGVVTLTAATLYKGLASGGLMLELYGPGTMLLGALAAWLSALFAVRWMVRWLESRGLALFGWYRVALALVVGCALLAGWRS